MKSKILTASVLSALLLAACAQPGDTNRGVSNGGGLTKSDIGTLAGAGLGAWGGSNIGKGKGNIAAIAAGTLLGAWAGSEVGASLDRADMAYYNNTSQRALESNKTGVTSTWTNPDSGNSGTITPTRTINEGNTVCREYTQTINVGGKQERAYGQACRQPDGSWQIAN